MDISNFNEEQTQKNKNWPKKLNFQSLERVKYGWKAETFKEHIYCFYKVFTPNYNFLVQFEGEVGKEEHFFFKVRKGRNPSISLSDLHRRLIFGYVIKLWIVHQLVQKTRQFRLFKPSCISSLKCEHNYPPPIKVHFLNWTNFGWHWTMEIIFSLWGGGG